jgi:hypothetical protein
MCGCQVLAGDTTFVSGLAAAGFGRVCSSQRGDGARRIDTDGYFLAVEGRRSNSTVHPDGAFHVVSLFRRCSSTRRP